MNMKRYVLSISLLSIMASAFAQDDGDLVKQAQAVLANAPPIHLQATILSIDRESRTVTVHGPHRDATLVVSPEVPNFDRLRVGDTVDVMYKNAVLVSAQKVTGKDAGMRKRVDTQSYQPQAGANAEGFQSSRRTEVLATVEKVDAKHRTVTLRGPWRTETLDVPSWLQPQMLKKGDTVHAVFLSAAAVSVTPANAAQ
jgi:prolyl oligopeptidase PreP (S9A serine peptidase family)